MDSNLAQGLGPLVKNQKLYSALKEYAEYMIRHHKDNLVIAKDMETVNSNQGAIKALKRLLTLDQEVEQIFKDLKK